MRGLAKVIANRKISEQMRDITENVVIPFAPITRPPEPPIGNWLITLDEKTKFIAGGKHDCYLTEYLVFKKNNNYILLQELKVQGKLDLSKYHWVDSELFSMKYSLKDIIVDD